LIFFNPIILFLIDGLREKGGEWRTGNGLNVVICVSLAAAAR
jgi:hypothetical protein